jgi:hypothetical protein
MKLLVISALILLSCNTVFALEDSMKKVTIGVQGMMKSKSGIT